MLLTVTECEREFVVHPELTGPDFFPFYRSNVKIPGRDRRTWLKSGNAGLGQSGPNTVKKQLASVGD
ncbi:unnamed protein product [Toxocara canis]|uniref:Calpain catalytic domain-containing protein n=1 Tax=Toxocara canis TaxID=6265 RepID=A0A183V4S1_TOXCA|nr:unnamed protein product [Toxocara canis]